MTRRGRRFALVWLPPLAWMGLIFFFSSRPDIPGPPQPLLDLVLKKGGHFLAYGVLAALYARAFSRCVGGSSEVAHAEEGIPGIPTGVPGAGVWLLAWMVAVLYGVSDELHQSFVPGRNARFADVMIDACGAACVLLLVMKSRRLRERLIC